MPKILSQSGISLADTYDVEGSIAGIETLETRDLPIVHEMGGTVMSERIVGNVFRAIADDVLQNTDFNILLNTLPIMPNRLLAVQIFTDAVARVARAAVIMSSPPLREIPIWVWDQTNSISVDFSDNGAAVAAHVVLEPVAALSHVPNMFFGSAQPRPADRAFLRGRTAGFGAGTVDITMLLYVAFPEVQGIPSIGLPVPSW